MTVFYDGMLMLLLLLLMSSCCVYVCLGGDVYYVCYVYIIFIFYFFVFLFFYFLFLLCVVMYFIYKKMNIYFKCRCYRWLCIGGRRPRC